VSNLLWIVGALVVSILGSLWLWARSREPRSLEHSIEEFARGLRALAPDRSPPMRREDRRSG
jgi:hypothetical protein